PEQVLLIKAVSVLNRAAPRIQAGQVLQGRQGMAAQPPEPRVARITLGARRSGAREANGGDGDIAASSQVQVLPTAEGERVALRIGARPRGVRRPVRGRVAALEARPILARGAALAGARGRGPVEHARGCYPHELVAGQAGARPDPGGIAVGP